MTQKQLEEQKAWFAALKKKQTGKDRHGRPVYTQTRKDGRKTSAL